MPFSDDAIDDIFTYHAPTPEQREHYEAIREGARAFAKLCVAHTPPSADQTAGVRLLRQTVMTFNQAIATNGKY